MLQSSQFDSQVFEGMKKGKQAMEQLQKKMNIDEMEDIKDAI